MMHIFVQTTSNFRRNKKGDSIKAGSSTNISIRMDSDLKAQADALFADLKK